MYYSTYKVNQHFLNSYRSLRHTDDLSTTDMLWHMCVVAERQLLFLKFFLSSCLSGMVNLSSEVLQEYSEQRVNRLRWVLFSKVLRFDSPNRLQTELNSAKRKMALQRLGKIMACFPFLVWKKSHLRPWKKKKKKGEEEKRKENPMDNVRKPIRVSRSLGKKEDKS